MKAYRVMANEKWFENIRKSLVNLYHAVDIDKETKQYIFNDLKIDWLIKQAERVQELEETVEDYKTVNKELHQRGRKIRKQNKRYREALEEISNADWNSEGLDAERELDKVTDVASKALEGESK